MKIGGYRSCKVLEPSTKTETLIKEKAKVILKCYLLMGKIT